MSIQFSGLDMGSFDYNDSSAGNPWLVPEGVEQITVSAQITGAYDDAVAVEVLPHGSSTYQTLGTAITATGVRLVLGTYAAIRMNPTGGGSAGSIQIYISAVAK